MKLLNICNKKGSQLLVNMVIILFVVLAVGSIILVVINNQFKSQVNNADNYIKENENNYQCFETCKKARLNGCTLKDKIEYCTTKLSYDMDNDNELGLIETNLFDFCEDSFYCPLITSCTCGEVLDINKCLEIVKQDYANSDLTIENIKETYKFTNGQCTETSFSWYKLYGVENPMPEKDNKIILPDIPDN